MYLRTQKKYQRGHRERHVFNLRWLWLWIFTPVIAIIGWQIVENSETLRPTVRNAVESVVDSARVGVSTLTAPTPLPTAEPAQDIGVANNAWQQGAIEQALTLYQGILGAVPNDSQIHYRVTWALVMQGRDEEALAASEATLNANPFSSDAWAIRALALDRNERYAQAIAAALQALSINPNNARALAFMAEAYLDAEQLPEAEEAIARALELDPELPEALLVNGLIILATQFDYETARTSFRTAYESAPNLPYLAVELAWSEVNLDNYDVAVEVLQGVLEQNPSNLDALFAIGFIYSSGLGDFDAALDALERCTSIDPANISCLRSLTAVQTTLGDASAALITHQNLINAGTTRASDYFFAARAYINGGECNRAIALLREGYRLEAATDFPDAELLTSFDEFLSDCGASRESSLSFDAAPVEITPPSP